MVGKSMYRATYKTGASLILKVSNDVDVVRFYDTEEERREALIHYKHDDPNNVHFDSLEKSPRVFLGCYIYHFMELIEGEDLHLDEFNIFDHKEEYVALLKKYTEWLPLENKWWYHILTAVYMYANGSYELTDKQLADIQRTHDKGISNAKHKYCIEQLELLN